MHEPIQVKDLIRMLQRENPNAYVFSPISTVFDVNDENVKWKKFGCDIGVVSRPEENRVYLLATHC